MPVEICMAIGPSWPRPAIIPIIQAFWTNITAVVATIRVFRTTMPIISTRINAIGAKVPAIRAVQDTILAHPARPYDGQLQSATQTFRGKSYFPEAQHVLIKEVRVLLPQMQ